LEEWITPPLRVLFPFTSRRDEINVAFIAFQIVEEMGGEVVGFHVLGDRKVDQRFIETISSFAKELKIRFHVAYRERKRSVVEELLSELKKGYDLCVCSSGSGIRVLGDVAQKLIKKSSIKMLVLHTPKVFGVLPRILNRILVVHTNTGEDINAYSVAMVLSKSWLSIKGEVVAVYPVRVHSSIPIDLAYVVEETKEEEKNFLRHVGVKIKDIGSLVTPVTLYARNGAEGLAAYADETKADIILVGVSRKRYPSRFTHMIPLSYAYFLNTLLRRSSCPVLLAFS